jgi:hypothetical protein
MRLDIIIDGHNDQRRLASENSLQADAQTLRRCAFYRVTIGWLRVPNH